MRFIRLVVLCFFLSGCSYQQVALPTTNEPSPEEPLAKIGQTVKVTTTDGSKFEGEVVSVSVGEIVLGKPGNYGFEETVIRAEDIVEIKTEKVHGVVSGIAVGSALLFSLLILAASQIEWGTS